MTEPKRVNAFGATIGPDGKYLFTIGSSDMKTVQYVFGDAMLDLAVDEMVRVKLSKMQEPIA